MPMMIIAPTRSPEKSEVEAVLFACSLSPFPRSLDMYEEAPAPNIMPRPMMICTIGNTTDTAPIWLIPRPPTKYASIALYSAEISIPTIVGIPNLSSAEATPAFSNK